MLLRIRRPWSDGTRAVVFEPLELLARLAALTPRPRVNLLLYHGVFAPHARGRSGAVSTAARARPADIGGVGGGGTTEAAPVASTDRVPEAVDRESSGEPAAVDVLARVEATREAEPHPEQPERSPSSYESRKVRWFAWADLLRRVFEIDVLACVACGGRLRLLATIDHPDIIRQILAHLGLPTALPAPAPARPPPANLEFPFDSA